MKNNRVNFVARLVVIPISFTILLPFWIIIGICSLKHLGNILQETGKRLNEL